MQYDHRLNAMSAEELTAVRDEKGRARRRRTAARERAEDLQRRLARAEELKPGSGARFAAGVFSVLTHAATLGVLAGSVFLLLSGNVAGMVAGALGLGVVWVVRPRISRAVRGDAITGKHGVGVLSARADTDRVGFGPHDAHTDVAIDRPQG